MQKALSIFLTILFFTLSVTSSVSADASVSTDSETEIETVTSTILDETETDTEIQTESNQEYDTEPTTNYQTNVEVNEFVMLSIYPNQSLIKLTYDNNLDNVSFIIEQDDEAEKIIPVQGSGMIEYEYGSSSHIIKIVGYRDETEFYSEILNHDYFPVVRFSLSENYDNTAEIKYSKFVPAREVVLNNGYETLPRTFDNNGVTNISIPRGIGELSVTITLKNNTLLIYTPSNSTDDNTEEETQSYKFEIRLDRNYSNIKTNESEYKIKGIVSNAASIYINGELKISNSSGYSGNFEIPLALEQGDNVFLFEVEDMEGIKHIATFNINRSDDYNPEDEEKDKNEMKWYTKLKVILSLVLSAALIVTILILRYRIRKNQE